MDKLVSVIVPVYNVEKYLNRCMKSIVEQTYQNIDIILIDDGSKDQSGSLCDAWREKDARVSVIHQKNGGLSNARNHGMEMAAGEYWTFVDSDDVIASNMIAALVKLIESEQADIAICGVNHIFDEGKINFVTDKAQVQTFDRESAIKEMWYQKSFLPSAWGKIYKRQVFKNLGFTEGILFEDMDIMHELFWNSRKLVYTEAPLYGYVHRENSITTACFSQRDCDILRISEKLLQFAEKNSIGLLSAAQSYAVTAAFRIYLNAPLDQEEYSRYRLVAETILNRYGKSVMNDDKVRKKTKCALLLYFFLSPLLMQIYKRTNRWK